MSKKLNSTSGLWKFLPGFLFFTVFTIQLVLFFPSEAKHGEPWFTINGGYAYGLDGYYYAYQVREYLERGYFPVAESSPVLYVLVLFSFLGKNVIATNKLAAAFLKASLVFPSYGIGRLLDSKKTGFLFSLFITSSFFLLHYTYEYIKNLGAIVFFLIFLYLLLTTLKKDFGENLSGKKIFRYFLVFIFFVLSVLSHKIIAIYSLSVVIFSLMLRYGAKMKYLLLPGVAVFFYLASYFIPYTLNEGDLERLNNYFSLSPGCYACGFIRRSTPASKELLAFVAAFFVFIFFIIRDYKKHRDALKTSSDQLTTGYFTFLFMFLVSINPFTKPLWNEAAYRLLIMVFIPGSFFLALVFSRLGQKIRAGYLLLPFIIFGLFYQGYHSAFFYKRTQNEAPLYAAMLPELSKLPENSLLVAHQGLDYYYWYYTGKKAFHFMPEEKHLDRPLYRVVYGAGQKEFQEKTGSKQTIVLSDLYLLTSEKEWKSYLSALTKEERERRRTWKNPYQYRKDFLQRNQNFRKNKPAGPR